MFIGLRTIKSIWLMLYFYFLQEGLALKLYSQIFKYGWPLIWLRGRVVSKAEVVAAHDPLPPGPIGIGLQWGSSKRNSSVFRSWEYVWSLTGSLFRKDHQNMVLGTWITNHLNNKQVKVLIHMSCYTDPHCITQNTTCVLIGKDTRNLGNNRLQNCAAIFWTIYLTTLRSEY